MLMSELKLATSELKDKLKIPIYLISNMTGYSLGIKKLPLRENTEWEKRC